MYFWEVEKTYEIEVFVQYILASGTVHLMNEYCAHTAGSFDAAMKNPDFKNVLNEFLDTFKSFNQ